MIKISIDPMLDITDSILGILEEYLLANQCYILK